jgi:hypothetical protein
MPFQCTKQSDVVMLRLEQDGDDVNIIDGDDGKLHLCFSLKGEGYSLDDEGRINIFS